VPEAPALSVGLLPLVNAGDDSGALQRVDSVTRDLSAQLTRSEDPPGSWWTLRAGCEAYLLLGQYDQAIAACEKAAGRAGEDFDIAYFLAAAYAHTGSAARAAEELSKIQRAAPGFTIATLRAKRYSANPEYMRLAELHWYSGLRKAGMAER